MKQFRYIFWAVLMGILLTACGAGSKQKEITIEMTEFAYTPTQIEANVGDEVTIKLVNNGALDHELMVGKEVMVDHDTPMGFEHDFFESVEPAVVKAHADEHAEEGHGEEGHADEGHADEGHADEADEHAEGDHAEGTSDHAEGEHMHEGFMVTVPGNSSEEVTITFTVTEDMVGEWEIGCFLDSGAHYNAGMVGTLIVSQ